MAALESALSQRGILHVDDNPFIRTAVRALLEARFGSKVRVQEAADGQEALLRMGLDRYDLVITDIDMPRLDGRRLVSELKARKVLPGLPLIVLSAQAEEDSLRQSMGSDALAYFPKPFDSKSLLDFIRLLLGLYQPEMEITPIGLRSLAGHEYTDELNSTNYDSVSSPNPCRQPEMESLLLELKRQQDLGGVEMMSADPIAEGINVQWRASCEGLCSLIRVIGYAAKAEPSRIPGWYKVTVKPRFFNRRDIEAAQRMSQGHQPFGMSSPHPAGA